MTQLEMQVTGTLKTPVHRNEINLNTVVDRNAPQWQLRCLRGIHAGKVFPLWGLVTLGREASCQILFPGQTRLVSRCHCRIQATGAFVTVWDLDSRFGTRVNGLPIPPYTPRNLALGDLIELGEGGPLLRLEQVEKQNAKAPRYAFSVVSGDGAEYISGPGGSLSFGRRERNTVRIPPDQYHVSGYHCELYRAGGYLFLRDLGSLNGTYLNGCRLAPYVPYRVVQGNCFFLGEVRYFFTIDQA